MREAEKAREKAAAKAGKAGKATKASKTIEIGWGIDRNDLGHRMKRMQDFLERGLKVEVVVAQKKRRKEVEFGQAEGVLEVVRETALRVPGVKEVKAMTGEVGKGVTLTFEGPQAQMSAQVKGKE